MSHRLLRTRHETSEDHVVDASLSNPSPPCNTQTEPNTHSEAHKYNNYKTTVLAHSKQLYCGKSMISGTQPSQNNLYMTGTGATGGGGGTYSSLGSCTVMVSGSGCCGPVFPVGSCGSIIITLIPRTPWRRRTWRYAVSTYCLTGFPDEIMYPSLNFIVLARCARSLPDTETEQP